MNKTDCLRCKRLVLCNGEKVFFHRITGKECDDFKDDGKGVNNANRCAKIRT